MDIPANPSIKAFIVPSITGFFSLLAFGGTGSHNNWTVALLMVNLKTWSANLGMKIVAKRGTIMKPIDPAKRPIGRMIRPTNTPNRARIRPVKKN